MKIALCGIGTVGGGVVKVLAENQAQFQAKYKENLVISHVLTRDPDKVDRLGLESAVFTDRVEDIYEADIDLVVEVMGGVDFAYQVIRQSLSQGRHVVTANKDLLALHIDELQALANEKGVSLLYEASVAGGIPIINGVQVGLAANQISGVMGILNGTTNYMLSHMTQDGWTYDHALSVAQEKGYAEADPTFDIEGHDAGHKITIMSALAFGTPVNFQACYLEGISKLDSRDIKYAEELGYRIKLLGITRKTDKGIELRVHPTLLPESRLLANVNGVMNAVRVNADMVGETLYYGAGAGALPTASAVVADIIDIARLIDADTGHRVPHLAFQPSQVQAQTILPMDEIVSSYYLRVQAQDKPGVLGRIANLLADQNVSIEALIQKGVVNGDTAEIVILTHSTVEKHVKAAIAGIEGMDTVNGKVTMIRMESLND